MSFPVAVVIGGIVGVEGTGGGGVVERTVVLVVLGQHQLLPIFFVTWQGVLLPAVQA